MEGIFAAYVLPALIIALKSVVLLVVLLIVVAYLLYADRKIWAAVQLRRGPNVVGPWGLFQAFADLLKFVFKEPIIPSGANKGVFLLAPFISAVLAMATWAVIPVNEGWAVANINVGILYIFAILRSKFMASSWAAGHRIRNIRSSVRFVLPRRWFPMKFPSVS